VIDGVEHLVDAREVRPGTWSPLIAGRSWLIDLDARKRGTTATAGAVEVPVAVEDARRRRLAQAVAKVEHGGDEVVLAPIAGKVVKILAQPGDRVAAGKPVIVLEAMKMENEITAVRGGTVKQVHVNPGQSVENSDKLLTLTS
ncbi:MAG TPA: biotin/lipoyl-containing protein, partial [Kofleriaceae bacterium]|nr:biotin/lipoyl-containing protein [Kofleriaceae bacterium]